MVRKMSRIKKKKKKKRTKGREGKRRSSQSHIKDIEIHAYSGATREDKAKNGKRKIGNVML
jgi:hypothetical protein